MAIAAIVSTYLAPTAAVIGALYILFSSLSLVFPAGTAAHKFTATVALDLKPVIAFLGKLLPGGDK